MSEKTLRKIIISKIIIDLIKYYQNIYTYEKKYEKECQTIYKNNIDIIKNNLSCLKNIKLELNIDLSLHDIINVIIGLNIDVIYAKIIISLIKNNKFEDEKYMRNIISDLDLKYIYITKTMFSLLDETLNNHANNYKITIENLLEEKIINFYYFLLKYILKNRIYINLNTFLCSQRETIINIINNSLYLFKCNIYINEKLDYIIETFTNSNLYEKFMEYFKQNNSSYNSHNNYNGFYTDSSSFYDSEDRDNAINNSQSLESAE